MKSIGIVLGGLVFLAMFAKDYSWRVKGIVLALLIAMVIVLVR